MKGIKGTIDEGGVRSTCFLRWPARLPADRRISEIAGAIDLLPTLTALAGIPRVGDKPLDGKDLSPWLLGAPVNGPARMIFSTWGGKVSVRTQTHRLDGQGQLFDMTTDPGQTQPVTAQQKSLAEQLAAAAEHLAGGSVRRGSGVGDGQDRPEIAGQRGGSAPVSGRLSGVSAHVAAARDGQPRGGIKRSSAAPNCSYFVNWTRLDDSLVWDIDVPRPARMLWRSCTRARWPMRVR